MLILEPDDAAYLLKCIELTAGMPLKRPANYWKLRNVLAILGKSAQFNDTFSTTSQEHATVELVQEKLLLTFAEGAEVLGVGRKKFSYLVRSGQIPTFLVGRRPYVRRTDVVAFAENLGQAA